MEKCTVRPRHFEIGEWGAAVKDYLPAGLRSLSVDLFFRYMPVSFIRFLWKELDGYFKLKTPRSGEVVVDAGVWTGHFTVIAARLVGTRGKVLAIEPQKIMCDRLKNRLKRLGLNNVTIVNSALFNCRSELTVPLRNDSGFSVLSESDGTGKTDIVSLRTLDEILDSLDVKQVDFIKMDIEGAEIEALSGMQSTLRSQRPFLAIASYHLRHGARTCTRVEEILKGYDYSAKTGHVWHLTTWGWCNADQNAGMLSKVPVARGI